MPRYVSLHRCTGVPALCATTLLGVIGVPSLLRAQSGLGFTKIVASGAPMPGGGSNFGTLGKPVIDGNTVVFWNFSVAQEGIYKWVDGTLSAVADRSTPMPHTTGNFTHFSQPSLSGDHISFSASWTSNNDQFLLQEGVYSAGPASIARIADRTTVIPSGSGETFTSFDPIPSVSNGLTSFYGGSVFNWGVYQGNGGTLTRVLGPDNAIPGGTGNFTGTVGSCLDGDVLAFKGLGDNNQQGIYHLSGGTVTRIADKSTQVPSSSVAFKEFGFPVRSGNHTVFAAVGADNYYGIYRHDGASLTKVVDRNTPVPSATSGTFAAQFADGFSGETRVPVDSNGNVIFSGGGPFNGGYFIYTASTGTIALIMRGQSRFEGQPLPAMYLSEQSISGRKIVMVANPAAANSALYMVEIASYAPSVNGAWDTAANWSFNAVPGPESSTLLSTGVNVTGPSAAATVRTLEVINYAVATPSTLTLQNGGPITATEGAVISPNGILAGSGTLTAGPGKSVRILGSIVGKATLSPGGTDIGTITIGGKLAFGESSELRIDLSTAGPCDVVTVAGDLDLTSGLGKQIVFVTGPGGPSGSDYTFLTCTGTRTGTFFPNNMPAGYTIDYSTPGQISIKAPPVTDGDHDSIPDAWEIVQAGNLTTLTATGDADSDGYSDLSEYIADTGALNAAQFLQITEFHIEPYYVEPDPDDPDAEPYEEVEVFVTWAGRSACRYAIETATSPSGPWEVQNEDILTGNAISHNDFVLSPIPSRLFVRVTASRPSSP